MRRLDQMIKTDVRDLIQRLYQTAREAHQESQEVFKHICWEAAELIDSFDQRVADLEDEVGELESKYYVLNKLYKEQENQIEKLKSALKPFAYYAKHIHDDVSDTASASGTVGDLRKARNVLEYAAANWDTSCRDLGEKE
jgi:DNA repair exonuclease SbcCD ATPase subunit